MGPNSELSPDDYLLSGIQSPDETIHDNRPLYEEQLEEYEHEHIDSSSSQYTKENVYDNFDTPDDTTEKRKKTLRNIATVVMVGLVMVAGANALRKASNETAQEEIRKISAQAKIPQDLNISSDSMVWQTTRDVESDSQQQEINQLQAEIKALKEGRGIDSNVTASNQPSAYSQTKSITPPLSEERIASIVRNEIAHASRVKAAPSSGLTPPPPLNVNKMPKVIKDIAKKHGDPSLIDVNDFLTVSPDVSPNVPKSVTAAQEAGAKMLPPVSTNSSPQIPQQANFAQASIPNLSQGTGFPQKQRVKINESSELKTGYGSAQAKASQDSGKPSYYLMPGLAKATLITGFLAPTLTIGEGQPKPVMLSLDSDVITANDSTINIQDCTMTGVATGNLSTSRAEIRLNQLNCVFNYKNGRQGRITQEINAWVYDKDSMYGLKGRLVSSEGKVIKAAMPISIIQALIGTLAQASSSATTVSTGVLGATTTTTNPGGIAGMEQGAMQGASQGMNKSLQKLVDYYLSMLKELNPSVEVLGGRSELTVMFKGGKVEDQEYHSININNMGSGRK